MSRRRKRTSRQRPQRRPICIMGLWDLHYPYQQPEVLDIFLQVAREYRPDILIAGGDQLDSTAVSSHGPSARTRVEQPIDLDFEGLSRTVLAPLDALGARKKIFFEGNHEVWLADYAEAHPEIGKSLDVQKQLRLAERGWTFIPYKKFWTAPGGKLVFHHGDLRSGRKSMGGLTKYHACDFAVKTHRCIRYGHAHTLMSYTIPNQLEPEFPINGLSLPCACRTDLPYLEGSATNWVQGFYIGWIRPKGTFNDFAVVVVDGEATFAGRTYKAKRR